LSVKAPEHIRLAQNISIISNTYEQKAIGIIFAQNNHGIKDIL
jgi:hypothetical protein